MKRRVHPLHPWYWAAAILAPVLTALFAYLLGRDQGVDPRLPWAVAGPVLVLAVLWLWLQRRTIVLDQEGITEATRRGRRFIPWQEVKGVDREGEPSGFDFGRQARTFYVVRIRGGRRLSFHSGSVAFAGTLARRIQDEVRRRSRSGDDAA